MGVAKLITIHPSMWKNSEGGSSKLGFARYRSRGGGGCPGLKVFRVFRDGVSQNVFCPPPGWRQGVSGNVVVIIIGQCACMGCSKLQARNCTKHI